MTAGALLALSALSSVVGGGAAAARVSQTAGPGSWTVYHGAPDGAGVAGSVAAVNTAAPAWTSPPLDGELYGEPLVSSGHVYVATEADTVYELSAATGAVLWSASVGRPVPSSELPCGDIGPTVGITGTPVIDPTRGEIFVVAEELVHGRPAHMFAGLSTATGKLEVTQDVDPAGADPAALLQRTGLALDDGRVVFGMGGDDGDCAAYRGRVIGVREQGGTPSMFTVDAAAGQSQGAVWMGGAAPVVDAGGDVWVSAGNGSVKSASRPYDDSDSILRLSPTLALEQFFAPASWPADNARDLDMSAAPALLPDGQVILTGKSRVAYLLRQGHLGGIGGQLATLGSACGGDIDGGVAVLGMTVYLPCTSGITAIQAVRSPAAVRLLWSSGTGGGPPIAAAGLVWTIGRNGVLYGLSPATGAVRQQVSIGPVANHFPTPSVADGLLLAPASDDVVAFAASATAAAGASSGAASSSAASPGASPAGGQPAAGGGFAPSTIAAIVLGAIAVIAGLAWLSARRRTT
jgi:polyvinyl alcohol dehydrogenase (cytochrome)